MYVKSNGGYCEADGTQHTRKAPFLILMTDPRDTTLGGDHMRGIVRIVAMRSCGNFMMGQARVKGHTISLSGSYGGDGLPVYKVPQEVYDAGKDIPPGLYHLWNTCGGHNSCGNEAPMMRDWARKNFPEYF